MKLAFLGATGETRASILDSLLASTDPKKNNSQIRRSSGYPGDNGPHPSELALEAPSSPRFGEEGGGSIRIASVDLEVPEDDMTKQLTGQWTTKNYGPDPPRQCRQDGRPPAVRAVFLRHPDAGPRDAYDSGGPSTLPFLLSFEPRPRLTTTVGRKKELVLEPCPKTFVSALHRHRHDDVGWWYQISLPRASPRARSTRWRVPFRISRGSSPGPRTLRDHRVFAYTELLSQNDVYGLIERLSGSYRKSWGLRGDNTPEYARYLGYQMGIDLYHDLVGNSFEDFCEKASGWKAKPIYVKNRQAAIAAAAAATAAKNKDA
ncbi:hypothetical protein CTA1_634 [Colletotrichum tanaceti]|uniref:NmrA-like domain-containing protein n=1 Tax=Colletotrichum tanaceti TaxID=1306861 RepID=A0A4U6XSN1_9PEZI|nr:hypothetical protein CTA1_634 [Colletotrichum tanaceti]